MAALLLRPRHARKTKKPKYCHSGNDMVICRWVSHSTDHRGELPIIEDVCLWKGDTHLPTVKASGDHASFKQFSNGRILQSNHTNSRRRSPSFKQFSNGRILQSNHTNSLRRTCKTEKQRNDGVLKGGAGRYVLRCTSTFHTGRDSSRLENGCTCQVDCYQRENSSLSFANHSVDTSGVVTDGDLSLQHWLISECNKKDASMNNLHGQRMTTDARKSRKTITRVRRDTSPSMHVCKPFRRCMKKRKSSTSRENCQLLPQNIDAFWLLNLRQCLCHRLRSLEVKPAQKEHTSRMDRMEAYKLDYCHLPFVTEHTTRLDSRRILNDLSRAKLLALQDVKLPCYDKMKVPQSSGGNRGKPKRFSGSNQRKVLPNRPRSHELSHLSITNQGPSRAVTVEAKIKSKHESVLEVQKTKEREFTFVPVESMPCNSNKKYTLYAGDGKDGDGSCGKLAAIRQTMKRGLKSLSMDTMKGHVHSSSPSLGSKVRSLSLKYRPMMLEDLLGQRLVSRALSDAVSEDKVAPVYLFEGLHGTGKTSAARIFAMALNCINCEERKPCGFCNECTALISGNTSHVWEFDAASHNGIGLIHELMERIDFATRGPRYKVVIIEECHMFSSETWDGLLKVFEEPFLNAVFILITTDPGKLPHRIKSRCQIFHFLPIEHSDILNRLDHIAKLENIILEPGALSLIASESNGSLRSAETLLDQASLLGQRITLPTIQKLVGSVSDDKLIRLLDLALCSDVVGTVEKTREIVELGVNPLDLLSQLASLITNILASSYVPMGISKGAHARSMHASSGMDKERLRGALRILSEAEKQVRAEFVYDTMWLLAALLQLGPRLQGESEAAILRKSLAKASPSTLLSCKRVRGIDLTLRKKGREVLKRRVSTEMVVGKKNRGVEAPVSEKLSKSELEAVVDPPRMLSVVEGSSSIVNDEVHIHLRSPSNVGMLWLDVLKCCKPFSIRQLLENHGKLLALTFSAVGIVAHVVFEKPAEKRTALMHHGCITNAFKKVLGPCVAVELTLAADLQKAGRANYSSDIADAPATQSNSKQNAGCEVQDHQTETEILDVGLQRIPSCPSNVVHPPLESNPSCPPLSRWSSHCGAKTTLNCLKKLPQKRIFQVSPLPISARKMWMRCRICT